ncbi:MAG: hypothetical protein AAFO07_32255 [Bacteroidota bacterium]
MDAWIIEKRWELNYIKKLTENYVSDIMKTLPRAELIGPTMVKTSYHRSSKEMKVKIKYLRSEGVMVIEEKLADTRRKKLTQKSKHHG